MLSPNCLTLLFQKLKSWYQLPDGNWDLGTILQTSGNESLISLNEAKVSRNPFFFFLFLSFIPKSFLLLSLTISIV